jgi:hypothetical protein
MEANGMEMADAKNQATLQSSNPIGRLVLVAQEEQFARKATQSVEMAGDRSERNGKGRSQEPTLQSSNPIGRLVRMAQEEQFARKAAQRSRGEVMQYRLEWWEMEANEVERSQEPTLQLSNPVRRLVLVAKEKQFARTANR